jgi:hypothetical protein
MPFIGLERTPWKDLIHKPGGKTPLPWENLFILPAKERKEQDIVLPERKEDIITDDEEVKGEGRERSNILVIRRKRQQQEEEKKKPRLKIKKHTYSQQYEQSAERSWPLLERKVKYKREECMTAPPKRVVSANYMAIDTDERFGLIDDGSTGAGRMLIMHVMKRTRKNRNDNNNNNDTNDPLYDVRQGDVIHANRADDNTEGSNFMPLHVLSVGRHRYYPPGSVVTTGLICVPEEDWAPFK